MIKEKLIERCRDEQNRIAVATLKTPGDYSATTFARQSGVFHGLDLAVRLITEVLDEEDDDRKPRAPKFD